MLVVFYFHQHFLEKGTARSERKFVNFKQLILTGQGHISEILVTPQLTKSGFHIFLEFVPLETEFFFHSVLGLSKLFKTGRNGG